MARPERPEEKFWVRGRRKTTRQWAAAYLSSPPIGVGGSEAEHTVSRKAEAGRGSRPNHMERIIDSDQIPQYPPANNHDEGDDRCGASKQFVAEAFQAGAGVGVFDEKTEKKIGNGEDQQEIFPEGGADFKMGEVMDRPLRTATRALKTGRGIEGAFWKKIVLVGVVLVENDTDRYQTNRYEHDEEVLFNSSCMN